ncbi:hypothetical protein LEP1GSC186_1898 [Leptospira noguchii serovar Autumnalis str. ZUN142]|uniref:Uncharacterized protein n=1 Tax=Leptospira noguchii serovar Autumnalis str. ZUN142 TaxID=1085540 RepID=M6UG15_9LEPT|nr:hypothetical protein LEP1GSC186_1898 [Leptospira noguchii serovar Autumnalis str. ZUN142]
MNSRKKFVFLKKNFISELCKSIPKMWELLRFYEQILKM